MRLIEKVAEIKEAFDSIAETLNNIDDNNFDEKIYYIQETLKRTQSIREQLEKDFSKAELTKFNPDLDPQIKQIQKMFDSILREKTEERDAAGIELKNTLNQKKIASYIR